MDPSSLNYISLCTGGGGLDIGFDLAVRAARPVCYVEREAFACAHLVAAIEAGLMADAPLWSDAGSFNGRPWRGAVDFIIGGIPCQPHSVAGRRAGKDDDRDLWSATRRIIVQSRARGVLIENVEGMLSAGADEIAGAKRVWRDLQRLGFVVEGGLFSASEVGATHRRARLFILAMADRDAGLSEPAQQKLCARRRAADSGGKPLANANFERCGERRAQSAMWERDGAADRSGDPMADSASTRSHAGAFNGSHCYDEGAGARHAEPQRRRHALADAVSGGRWRESDNDVSSKGADAGGTALANADQPQLQREPSTGQFSLDEPDAETGERSLANAGAGRCSGRAQGAQRGSIGRAFTEWTELAGSPPGPDEFGRWAALLEKATHLAPALSRLDGARFAGLQAIARLGETDPSAPTESEFRRMADDVAARLDLDRIDRLRMLGNGVHPLQAAYAIRTLGARLAARGVAGAAELFMNDGRRQSATAVA